MLGPWTTCEWEQLCGPCAATAASASATWRLGRGSASALCSAVEHGQIERMSVRTVRSICSVLEIRLPFDPRWRGGPARRACSTAVTPRGRADRRPGFALDWEAIPECTFNAVRGARIRGRAGLASRERAPAGDRGQDRAGRFAGAAVGSGSKASVVPPPGRGRARLAFASLGVAMVLGRAAAPSATVARHGATFSARHCRPDGGDSTLGRQAARRASWIWFLRDSTRDVARAEGGRDRTQAAVEARCRHGRFMPARAWSGMNQSAGRGWVVRQQAGAADDRAPAT